MLPPSLGLKGPREDVHHQGLKPWVRVSTVAGAVLQELGTQRMGLKPHKQASKHKQPELEASLEAKTRINTLACPALQSSTSTTHWSNLLENQLSREPGKCSCLQCRWHKLFRDPTKRYRSPHNTNPWAPGSGSTNTAGLGRSQPGRRCSFSPRLYGWNVRHCYRCTHVTPNDYFIAMAKTATQCYCNHEVTILSSGSTWLRVSKVDKSVFR